MSLWIPHPGASAPLSRNAQLTLRSPLKTNAATAACETTHVPPISVDCHILITGKLVKSSKKICGLPVASTTMSENCAFARAPLTSAGAEKGRPAPAECDSRITEEKAGILVALPSEQPNELWQNSV